ncbi:hypothetical protein [Rothia nasimurium]|uniref:hypothetical protein n=1 Tax=Rothia nasimurium TaxID=85336 RepID=UPI00162841AF|nr:hypothetical protein [Rothia nasimurium]
MSTEPTPGRVIQVGKFYTAARKFKQLIGQLPDGSTIPGGPYTLTQFVPTLILIIPYALKVRIFGWSSMTAAILETAAVLALCAISIFVLGQLPPTRRSLFHLITTTPALLISNRNGYWQGKPIKLPKAQTHETSPEPTIEPETTTIQTTTATKTTPRPASGFTRFQNSLK